MPRCQRRILYKALLEWRAADYLVAIAAIAIAALVGGNVRPHCRPFSWDDPFISRPLTPDTFPNYSLAPIIVLPLLVYAVGELLSRWWRPLETVKEPSLYRVVNGKRSALLHMNGWVLAHLYSFGLSFAIVNIAKLYAGRLRPDFLARLRAEGFVNDGSFDPSQATGPVCHAAREGRLSFPSGHSSIAFSSITPLSLYLLGLTRQLHHRGNFLVATLCMLPLILPIAVAISRTVDYHHNFDDVLCGSLVGSACAVFAVLFTFCASDTGEWTLRSHPVYRTDMVPLTAEERSSFSGPVRCILNVCDEHSSASSNSDGEEV